MAEQIQRQARRMSDHKVQSLADSAYLKLAIYFLNIVMVVLLSATSWGLNTLYTEMKTITKQLASLDTTSATTELRLKAVETGLATNGAADATERNRVTAIETKQLIFESQVPRRTVAP